MTNKDCYKNIHTSQATFIKSLQNPLIEHNQELRLPPLQLFNMNKNYYSNSTLTNSLSLPSFQELNYMINRQELYTKNQDKVMIVQQKYKQPRQIKSKKPINSQFKHKDEKKYTNKDKNRCHSCNITETPEWRKGPFGPRTLCNACGLIWIKLCKEYQTSNINQADIPQNDMVI